jgi:biopolymer transport protein ExbB
MDFIQDTIRYLQQGGWIMVPLVVCSVVMWAMILDRIREFRVMSSGDISIQDSIRAIMGEPVDVSGGGMRATLLRGFLAERSGSPPIDRDILRQYVMRRSAGLDKNLALIAVLAAIAPLLGLLGTVLGMIETFQVISLFGTGNAKAMASGISIALVTTQTGLLVAIPGLFLSGMLIRRSRHMKTQLDEDVTVLDRAIKKMAT